MQIDWFTFAAQIGNFLILVWLLKKFLYAPVLNAMEKRREALAERFREAEKKRSEAEAERKIFLAMEEEIRSSLDQELQRARDEAAALRGRLLKDVRAETDSTRRQWLETIKKEKKTFLEQTSRVMAAQFDRLSRAALADLADEDLEKKIIDSFLGKLANKTAGVSAMHQAVTDGAAVKVISGFKLDDPQKESITRKIRELTGYEKVPEFRQDKKLMAGIALEAGGRKISWDINRYLEDFYKEMEATLDRVVIS